MAPRTPSTVLYQDLKSLGITNKDAAKEIFDVNRKIGSGKTVGMDLEVRPHLSSKYVKAAPGAFDESYFRPFPRSMQSIAGRLLGNPKNSLRALEAHYLNEAADEMAHSLSAYGIEPTPYENALVRIEHGEYHKPQERFQLALMLFIICGSLADPKRAVALEEQFAAEWLAASVRTMAVETPADVPGEADGASSQQPSGLAIMRMNANGTFSTSSVLHVLPRTSEGATIGSGSCDITDVGPHVSRKHARIYFEGGCWQIVGLGSTNGTTVINGAARTEELVEPPRSERKRGYVPQPHEISPADIICLADDTRFIIQSVEG